MKIEDAHRYRRRTIQIRSPKPQRPDYIHQCVGRCRRQESATIVPCATVENPGNGSQQHVSPIEGQRLVEMGEPEDHGGHEQRARVTDTRLEQVLEQTAKVHFFRNGNEEECDKQRDRLRWHRRHSTVGREKADSDAKRDGNRSEVTTLAESNGQVSSASPPIVTKNFSSP